MSLGNWPPLETFRSVRGRERRPTLGRHFVLRTDSANTKCLFACSASLGGVSSRLYRQSLRSDFGMTLRVNRRANAGPLAVDAGFATSLDLAFPERTAPSTPVQNAGNSLHTYASPRRQAAPARRDVSIRESM